MNMSRRSFLHACAVAGALASRDRRGHAEAGDVRDYHLSISIDALNLDPELPDLIRDAGVTHAWLASFFHGHWHHTMDEVMAWKKRLEAKGLAVGHITIPLGHPTFSETAPDYMPNVPIAQWKPGMRPDGRRYFGVSLHPPATEENVAAIATIKATDPGIIFLDDDFRLSPSPHDIGGCFCGVCKGAFLDKHGYAESHWEELLEAVDKRALSPILRDWISDACDKLTESFRKQQAAALPEAQLGIMVMFLGSEKAGIRLSDYTGVPFRVGELMFNDESFAPVKGKTDQLFSALFHRRFTPPEQAFSETTAWPPDRLSAANMAAKLAVSTLADVRHTMFMSGIIAFPRTHWRVLGPAMKKHASLHRELAGHVPRGPLKHYWGEAARWVGDANPYSMFLALGAPFEVTEHPAEDGCTFLADADARACKGKTGGLSICRPGADAGLGDLRRVPETLEALFALKHELMPQWRDIPVIEEDVAVVCAWYPTARKALLWNLNEAPCRLTLRIGETRREISMGPLDAELIRDLG